MTKKRKKHVDIFDVPDHGAWVLPAQLTVYCKWFLLNLTYAYDPIIDLNILFIPWRLELSVSILGFGFTIILG